MASCKVAGWNDNTNSHNALATETDFITYTLTHKFNEPAECVVFLDDSAGGASQKYGVAVAAIYIGVGRIQLKEGATTVFDGRIIRAEADSQTSVMKLFCLDWMSQLQTELINYETREDLDGSGLRESSPYHMTKGATDYERATTKEAAGRYRLTDTVNGSAWAENKWNTGYHLVFSHRMAGSSEYWHSAYADGVENEAFSSGEFADTWFDDGDARYTQSDADGVEAFIAMSFQVQVPVAKIDRIEFDCTFADGDVGINKIQVLNYDGGGAYTDMWERKVEAGIQITSVNISDISVSSGVSYANIIDSADDTPNQRLYIRLYNDPAAGQAEISLRYARITIHTTDVTGNSTAYDIDDSDANWLEVSEDLLTAGIDKHCPYSIAQVLTNHVDDLITGYDPLKTLAHSITASTKVVAQHFNEMSPFNILKSFAHSDAAVFWCYLSSGDPYVKWQRTFTWSSGTLSDTDVIKWHNIRDFQTVYNEYHFSGIKTGDTQLYLDSSTISPDPGVDSKALFDITQTKHISNPGLYSLAEATTLAGTLIERDEDVHLILSADLAGWSSKLLGDVIRITSTRLSLTNADYVVVAKTYNHRAYLTTLRLYPIAAPFINAIYLGEMLRHTHELARSTEQKVSTVPAWTETW